MRRAGLEIVSLSGFGSTAGDVANAILNVIEDPALPEVARILNRFHQLEQSAPKKPGSSAPSTTKGIGLKRVVGPMRALLWLRENPAALVAGAVAVVAVPALLGYAVGRKSRR